jgi:hypothetical protein
VDARIGHLYLVTIVAVVVSRLTPPTGGSTAGSSVADGETVSAPGSAKPDSGPPRN